MGKPKSGPERLIRHIEKTTARYLWRHSTLWGLSKEDVFARALEAVWQSGARTPGQADRAIFAALAKCRDESKHNRSCLQPYHVRKAEKEALTGNGGKDPEAVRQAAYREFLDDCALFSQRTAFREGDRLRVRKAIAALTPEDREIAHKFLVLGSIKGVALSFRVAPRTYLRREWAAFKERFVAAWMTVDEEEVVLTVSSNPCAFAEGCASACHDE